MLGLIARSLRYYWRTNAAVVAGVAVAVAVFSGALLVGSSVRGSLRALALERLGSTDHAVIASRFVRDSLADDLSASPAVLDAVPVIVLDGFVTHPAGGRRAGSVTVYGVDERFVAFHAQPSDVVPASDDTVRISRGLARELGVAVGDDLLVRVSKPSDVPSGWLHGRRDDTARTLRLSVEGVAASEALGDFSLRIDQGVPRTVFVSMTRLQRDLGLGDAVNVLLVRSPSDGSDATSTAVEVEPAAPPAGVVDALDAEATLADRGVRLRLLETQGRLQLEATSGIMAEAIVAAAESAAGAAGMTAEPALTYLVNRMRVGGREVAYSLVAALDPGRPPLPGDALADAVRTGTSIASDAPSTRAPIVLNEWAARDLEASEGDVATLEYFVWENRGRLSTRRAEFRVAGVVPLEGAAADPDLAPEYPGITEADDLVAWDPPFPIDLGRIRPRDEEYWDRHRTTPKAFVPLAAGRAIWSSRYGRTTSVRVVPESDRSLDDAGRAYAAALRERLDPVRAGFEVRPVRRLALAGSVGATDFGEYFVYFSFFLVVAALLLMTLFFRLGVEQRLREIGALRALGFSLPVIRRLFVAEGATLAALGGVLGSVGALAYAAVIMHGLRTWWVDATGTTALVLHVAPMDLAAGATAGVTAAVACVAVTLRGLAGASPRSLIAGVGALGRIGRGARSQGPSASSGGGRRRLLLGAGGWAVLLVAAAMALSAASAAGTIGATAGFFAAGGLMLCAMLAGAWSQLSGAGPGGLRGHGLLALVRLGFRNTAYRPGRSVLCIALIASAAFIIVAVDAFRREGGGDVDDRLSGTGGFALFAESTLPIIDDPGTPEGREALGLTLPRRPGSEAPRIHPLRLRQGEDASCLNLYRPENPRILGVSLETVADRFAFGALLEPDEAERRDPWLLLRRRFADGAIPAIADATSLAYALHLSVGDDLVLTTVSGSAVTLRIVGALRDSVFQSEVLVDEQRFLEAFPDEEGYRFFLVDVGPAQIADVTLALESQLSDVGFDVRSVPERIAAYHRVENTYLATFQALGALGLLLGTLGLAAVLFRNALERRRELALMRAIGFGSRDLTVMVLSENAFLLVAGTVGGVLSAAIAIAPAWVERGGNVALSVAWLLVAVLVSGLAASVAATVVSVRSRVVPALKAE